MQMTEQKDGTGILLSLESKNMAQLKSAQRMLSDTLPSDARATSVEYDTPVFGRGVTPRASLEAAKD